MQGLLQNVSDNVVKFARTGEAQLIERADDQLRKAFTPDLDQLSREFIARARQGLKSGLPEDVVKKWNAVDAQYAKYKVAEHAGSYVKSMKAGGVFSPRNLQTATKAKGRSRTTSSGRSLLQNEAQLATSTLGKVMPARPQLDWLGPMTQIATGGAALTNPFATGAGLAGARAMVTEPMRRMMVGQNLFNPQSFLANALRTARLALSTQLPRKNNY